LEQKEENPIAKACKNLGVNQRELAELMGVSTNSVSWWKNNKQPIPKWAFRLIELLEKEKEHQIVVELFQKYKLKDKDLGI
jgi:transcriptional regulator with XRE-family HTH domain